MTELLSPRTMLMLIGLVGDVPVGKPDEYVFNWASLKYSSPVVITCVIELVSLA